MLGAFFKQSSPFEPAIQSFFPAFVRLSRRLTFSLILVAIMTANTERTYIMIKPDGVARGLTGEILARFERRGYRLVAGKLFRPSQELLQEHYRDLAAKPFFPGMIAYMSSGPVFCMVFEGKDAVKTGRKMLGATNPLQSEPGTIRGDFSIDVGRNICHGSDSVESAEREINLWFPEGINAAACTLTSLIYE